MLLSAAFGKDFGAVFMVSSKHVFKISAQVVIVKDIEVLFQFDKCVYPTDRQFKGKPA